ncbi:MAG: phosphoenolpyruvate--protein phosphotransferase [Candidatus Auribacterota bacterium]|jgi:phosphotransferase system enzyme I (PtsI)|nr:phosphoenolpyruvate--protein phosphotransferase [Candidatus Auribacterota bacterium]
MSGKEIRFQGLPISNGVAIAKVCLFDDNRHHKMPLEETSRLSVEEEIARLKKASVLVSQRLAEIRDKVKREIGSAEAEIFVAQKMILEDSSLNEQLLYLISSKRAPAELAITLTFDEYEHKLLAVDSEYIRQRASDIAEVKRRLLDTLSDTAPGFKCEGLGSCKKGRNRIVVTEELTPMITIELNFEHVKGFITERGGVTSHAAILARALGVPAVSGIHGLFDVISCGTQVLINGQTGEVVVCPEPDTIAQAHQISTVEVSKERIIEPVDNLKVYANINLSNDVDEALELHAEGIGLYRTEFELFSAGRLLDEDEEFERYSYVVKKMNGKPVYFRMLDVGGDKNTQFFNLPQESNPYLGCRGARFLIARPDIFNQQARALARASAYGPVYVMYPMVVSAEQLVTLKGMFASAIDGIRTGTIYQGLMFEVPSACLRATELLEMSDFASIGSNDLIQYLFAVDRNNDLVAYDYNPDKPVFWDIIRLLISAAQKTGKPLSICGEIASDPKYTSKFIDIGLDTVSVSSRLIPHIRLAAMEQSL